MTLSIHSEWYHHRKARCPSVTKTGKPDPITRPEGGLTSVRDKTKRLPISLAGERPKLSNRVTASLDSRYLSEPLPSSCSSTQTLNPSHSSGFLYHPFDLQLYVSRHRKIPQWKLLATPQAPPPHPAACLRLEQLTLHLTSTAIQIANNLIR